MVYNIQVQTLQLLPGQQRLVNVPGTIDVAVGENELVELSSYGRSDVRARLYDAQSALVAQSDDRADDWNFLIARKLTPGQYRLSVEAVSGSTADTTPSTTVSMQTPVTRLEQALTLPAQRDVNGAEVHVYPIAVPSQPTLLVLQADADDTTRLSVEAKQNADWRLLGSAFGKAARLIVPLEPAALESLQVRVWSVDHRDSVLHFNAQSLVPESYGETRLQLFGVKPQLLPGKAPRLAVAALALERPGVFQLQSHEGLLWSAQVNHALSAATGDLLIGSGNTVWIGALLQEDQTAPRIKAARLRWESSQAQGLPLSLAANQTAQVDMSAAGDAALLVVAESRVGRAGVQLLNQNEAAQSGVSTRRFATAERNTASVLIGPRDPVAKLWNAEPGAGQMDVTLRQTRFNTLGKQSVDYGQFHQSLAPHAALRLQLPKGAKRVALTLAPQMAAVMDHEGRISATHWSGGSPLNESVDSEADALVMLNAGEDEQAFELLIDALPDTLSFGAINARDRFLQRRFANAGQTRISVDITPKPATVPDNQANGEALHLRGDVQGTYLQGDGSVLQGKDFTISASGILLLRHQPGLFMAWLDSDAAEITTPLQAPLTLDTGTAQTIGLQGRQLALSVEVTADCLLQLRSESPLVTKILHSGLPQIVELHPNGANYAVYLPQGRASLQLQSIGAESLSGELFIRTAAIEPLQEGVGPATLLSGGGAKLYRFHLKQAGPIGLGVQASSDVVSGILMTRAGKEIGRGVIQMPTLEPGDYVYALSVPQTSAPVRVRPVLVGSEPPGTGPPVEVIQQYLQQAGRKLQQ